MIQPPMYLFRLHLSRLNGGVRSLNPLKGGMKEGVWGVTARRQREEGDDKAATQIITVTSESRRRSSRRHCRGLDVDLVGGLGGEEVGADAEDVDAVEHRVGDVERGGEPERCQGEEEGGTDVPEELIAPVEEVSEML
ncbi:hypothetical protein BOVATA_047560 [Babesia ovata]|uniref:Uncharacterized protein n=1 Tax=Babesia ovata TaxID=189622 RepID=A0A2H6KJT7_9APIC|nr:uncharacterized protein BOVATA_047560 [Babesia ovata]GBE63263.1 hypothetical protein BOVATA_047560 [Babesia ovata]